MGDIHIPRFDIPTSKVFPKIDYSQTLRPTKGPSGALLFGLTSLTVVVGLYLSGQSIRRRKYGLIHLLFSYSISHTHLIAIFSSYPIYYCFCIFLCLVLVCSAICCYLSLLIIGNKGHMKKRGG